MVYLVVACVVLQCIVLVVLFLLLSRSDSTRNELKDASERIRQNEKRLEDATSQLRENKIDLQSAFDMNEVLMQNKTAARHELEPLLRNLRESIHPLQTLNAIKAFADLGAKGIAATPELEALLREQDNPAIRVHALEAIAQVHPKKFEVLLRDVALRDPLPGVAAHAAMLAGSNGVRSAMSRLWEVADGADNKAQPARWDATQRACAWALHRLGNEYWYKKLKHERRLYAYILASAPKVMQKPAVFQEFYTARRWTKSQHSGILEAAVVQGDSDVILKVVSDSQQGLSDLIINDIQAEKWILATQTLLVVNRPWHMHWISKQEFANSGKRRPAWVLMAVPAGKVAVAVITASQIDGVREAAAVFGDKEVVVKIVSDSEEEDVAILRKLNHLPYVQSTHTYRSIAGESFNQNIEAEASLFDGLY